MGRAEEEADDDMPLVDDLDPESGTRKKRTASQEVQLLMAEFRGRTKGLPPDALEAEIDRLMGKMIERHAAVVPERMRPELRELLRGMIEEDPTVRALVGDLRESARRRG